MDPITNYSGRKTLDGRSILSSIFVYLFIFLFVALTVWSFLGLIPDLANIRNGSDGVKRFVGPMIPQSAANWRDDFSILLTLKIALYSTIQMAVAGTVVGALFAFPASFFAARTGIIPRPVSGGIKSVFNIGRSVPTIIVALIVVGCVGLGDAAGAITLALVTFVTLTKLFAEALETVNPGPIEAVKAVGGNSASVFVNRAVFIGDESTKFVYNRFSGSRWIGRRTDE